MKNEERQKIWDQMICKGRADFTPDDSSRICLNHFRDGNPTMRNQNPTLYLTLHDYRDISFIYLFSLYNITCEKHLQIF